MSAGEKEAVKAAINHPSERFNMKTKDQQEKSSTKEFNLTEDEKNGIDSRQAEIKRLQYLIHCINEEIVTYTNMTVCKRIGMKIGQGYKLSPDNTKIFVDYDTAKTE